MSRTVHQRRATQGELGAWQQVVVFHARVAEMVENVLNNQFDLSLSEYGALNVLAESASGGMRMAALADEIGLDQSSVSRLATRLERRHLAQRSQYERDRRGVYIQIADEGRELLAAVTPAYVQTLAAAFDKAIADPELQEFVKRIGAS